MLTIAILVDLLRPVPLLQNHYIARLFLNHIPTCSPLVFSFYRVQSLYGQIDARTRFFTPLKIVGENYDT